LVLPSKLRKIIVNLAGGGGIVPPRRRCWFGKLGLVLATEGLLTSPLHASAKAAFDCFECLVEVGLAGQVGVKSKNICRQGGVFM
jgi:hypothetical protein